MKGKKLVAMLLASVMCLSLLAGCNGKKDPDTTPTPSAENTQPVVTKRRSIPTIRMAPLWLPTGTPTPGSRTMRTPCSAISPIRSWT